MRRAPAALIVALATPTASAATAAPHPELAAAVAELERNRGPTAPAALTRLWNSWRIAHPDHVEEALRAAAGDARLTPSARAYAGLLAAYSRLRRGDLARGGAEIERLGWVRRWMVVGPFDDRGKVGLDQPFEPERRFSEPLQLGASFPGKERPVAWRVPAATSPWGVLDFGAYLRPFTESCAYAATFVVPDGPRPPTSITAWIGAAGSYKLFWNGRERTSDRAYRGLDFDRSSVALELPEGPSTLLLKVCNDRAAPMVSVRLADARGGPPSGVRVSLEPSLAGPAAERARATKDAPRLPPAPPGPLQEHERRTRGDRPSAAALEAFADYLVVTGGDDPVTHQARDLARRAAEQEPTVARLLAAGELAEDANARREWVAKAEALVGKGEAPVALLVARAKLAAAGPDPREALARWDDVLARDPDHLDALTARVTLLNEASLRRTALALLEGALRRNPSSTTLLNLTSSQLRAVGRVAEAAELEERYAAFRFDDRTWIGSQVDLAIARRDRAAAEHWVSRLLALHPDSLWAHGVGARTHLAFAQPERAIALWKAALELAPEDVDTLRELADLHGERGERAEQLALMRRVLALRPQDRAVREYVEHVEPPRPRDDEAYAWAPERFLPLASEPARGEVRRTLRDLTVTTVYPSGLASRFRQVVFQPLVDSAAAAARQYGFQYQADREVAVLRDARVFRGDGRVDEAVEWGESPADDPSIALYTSARNFWIQLPRLEPGDVVELRWRVDDVAPRNEFGDYFGELVYLQGSEPVRNAEYVLVTPKARAFSVDERLAGLSTEARERGEWRVRRSFAARLEPVRPEAGMPPWGEVLAPIHVSTFATWKDMGRWWWNLSREQFDLDDETRQLARRVGAGATTDEEKVKKVFGWVVKNTRYVALEFGIHGYKPRRCVQTVARGWGDCKDKATAIVTLLSELGVKALPVILRTRQRGDFQSRIASLAPFDHAIAYVPSLDLYLDGTAELAGMRELPRMDLGALALRIDAGEAELVRVPGHDPARNVIARTQRTELGPRGDARVALDWEVTGVDAPSWRLRYQATATRRERVTADVGREFPAVEVSEVTAPGIDDPEVPVRVSVRAQVPSLARREGARLTLAVTPDLGLTESFASLSRRTQDLVIIAYSTRRDHRVVRLPPGLKVVSLPPQASGRSRFGHYRVEVRQDSPQEVSVSTEVTLVADRVTVADYPDFAQFCAEVDRALTPRLVVQP